MYCKCGKTVHPVRLDLGYKTCVDCSTTQTYSYVPIIEHKTGNTIQIRLLLDNINMKKLKYVNYNQFGEPTHVLVDGVMHERVPYVKEWKKYITINKINYVE